jgi:hypothetical protein
MTDGAFIFFLLLTWAATLFGAFNAGQASLMGDCETMEKFRSNKVVYVCKKEGL